MDGTCAVAFPCFYRGLDAIRALLFSVVNFPSGVLLMVFASLVDTHQCRFEIRPNRSLGWRAATAFYCALVCVSMGVAVGFALLGFWPILPFAGVELLALGAAFYVVARRTSYREVVIIDDCTVAVKTGTTHLKCTWKFARAWTRVILSAPTVRWYPSKLLLRSHGKEIEVGEFLNERERRILAGDLRRVVDAGPDMPSAHPNT